MIPQKTACLIYKQTILPVLDYCGYIHSGLTSNIQRRLQHLQNRCLRVCRRTNMRHRVADLHVECNCDYLDVRYDLQLLLLIRKYLKSEAHEAEDFGIILKRANANGALTRSATSVELVYPTDNKLSYRNSPLYRGVDLWNKLPISCRLNPDRDSFKSEARPYVVALSNAKWHR